MPGRAAGLGRSAYSTMEFISVEDPSSQTAGLSLQLTASSSTWKSCLMLEIIILLSFIHRKKSVLKNLVISSVSWVSHDGRIIFYWKECLLHLFDIYVYLYVDSWKHLRHSSPVSPGLLDAALWIAGVCCWAPSTTNQSTPSQPRWRPSSFTAATCPL